MGDKRTPMAWQHRDINYHQNGYHQDNNSRYSQGADVSRGPPSTSDRLSHRTDKSWRTRDSNAGYGGPGSSAGPPPGAYQQGPSRESYAASGAFYGNERPSSRLHSQVTGSSSTTSSSSDEESERDTRREADPRRAASHTSRQPSYPAVYNQNPAGYMTYNGSMKPAHSVPALTAMGTFDGEPCPVHGVGSFAPLMGHPSMGMLPQPMGPEMGYHNAGMAMNPTMPRKAQSIYDMRLMTPAPPPSMPGIYGTLPGKPGMIPGDRRSLVGFPQSSGPPPNIPPHFLPPMARPRPLVMSEDGMTEPLPKRSPPNKNGFELPMKSDTEQIIDKWNGCSKGAICVAWIILSVICTGVVLGLLLMFIL